MKSRIVKSKGPAPSNPWADVKYPCLVEKDGKLGLCPDDDTLILLSGSDAGHLIGPRDEWEWDGWMPTTRTHVIELSNR